MRPSTAGMTERQGQLHPRTWPAILTREQGDAARAKRTLERVVVLPHPPGHAASHLDWAQRSVLLNQRLQLHWLA